MLVPCSASDRYQPSSTRNSTIVENAAASGLRSVARHHRHRHCRRCGRPQINPLPAPQQLTTRQQQQSAHHQTLPTRQKKQHPSRRICSGVAARTRLGHERGGSLLPLAQLQEETHPQPCKSGSAAEKRVDELEAAGRGREIMDIGLERSSARAGRSQHRSDQGGTVVPAA